MSDGPLISLTVCMRDAEHWVDHCLESLVKQTYRPLEIIAVDDGSSDDGYSKLKAWEGEHNGISVQVLKQPPTGLSAGRNLALEFAFSEEGGPVLLEVEGEEDLAPILIHLLAPLGTVVLYGQPSAGVVLRVTDESTKARCRALLNTFESR